jgi:hypothetical protein
MRQRFKTSPSFWIVLLIGVAIGGVGLVYSRNNRKPPVDVAGTASRPLGLRTSTGDDQRRQLFEEIQPVKLANCRLERFGDRHDGGYLLCANLGTDVSAGYSYGIGGTDQWGCDVSRRLSISVHQYDCFDLRRPVCDGGKTIFHEECVGGSRRNDGKDRVFDTMAHHFQRNGHSRKRLVVKLDVEGSEWASLLSAPDELLGSIDQLAVEFHGIDDERSLEVTRRLKRHFYVAHLHFNNYRCKSAPPFPADTYEMLFVSKRIGVLDPRGKPELPHPLDRPTNPSLPDCQLPKAERT